MPYYKYENRRITLINSFILILVTFLYPLWHKSIVFVLRKNYGL